MLENFHRFFGVSNVNINTDATVNSKFNIVQKNASGFNELINSYSGKSFGNGLYRLHEIENIEKWNEIITQAFPEFTGRISSFGFDWLGRQFALDLKRIVEGQPQILMFEPGTGEVLEIPCSFLDFHEYEIPNDHDACLSSEFFKGWTSQNSINLLTDKCIGYKVLLFLGGQDSLENLELCDMEVYWTFCSQLIQKIKELPVGTIINIEK
jgi:hypothetical protein